MNVALVRCKSLVVIMQESISIQIFLSLVKFSCGWTERHLIIGRKLSAEGGEYILKLPFPLRVERKLANKWGLKINFEKSEELVRATRALLLRTRLSDFALVNA